VGLSGKPSKNFSVPRRVSTVSGDAIPGGRGVEYLYSGALEEPVDCCPLPELAVTVMRAANAAQTDSRLRVLSRIYFWTAIHHRFTSSTPNGALIATCRSCRRWRTNCVRISQGVKRISVREQPTYALCHTPVQSIGGCLSAFLDCDSEYIFSERLVNPCP
jgi:hypothetical protein